MFLLTGGSTVNPMAEILSTGTSVLGWFVTSMGSLFTFITGQPVLMTLFYVLLVGAVVGMLFRVWKSI